MDTPQNIFIYYCIDFLGYYGPYILFIISILLFYKLPFILIIYIIGTGINLFINIILKLTFKQPRPDDDIKSFELMKANGKRILFDKYGFPSSHSQTSAYSTIFILMVSLQKINNSSFSFSSNHFSRWIYWVLLFLILTINTSYQRVKYRNHTLFQVIIGLLVGSFVGYCVFELSHNSDIIALLKPTSLIIQKNSCDFLKRFETNFNTKFNTNLI